MREKREEEMEKKFGPFLDLCVSSLERKGHANLLCIVPILSDVPEGININVSSKALYMHRIL